jgi:hypothetical protein
MAMRSGRPAYHRAEDGLIPCRRSRYIRAHGSDVPQGLGNAGFDRVKSNLLGVIYGATHLDNAVQDTER